MKRIGKLYFRYGTMGSAKTAMLLTTAYNFEERNMPYRCFKPVTFDVPTWEIILSLVILYISFIGVIWLAAKIYRVGIFMYGKKPSFVEIIRWARYK